MGTLIKLKNGRYVLRTKVNGSVRQVKLDTGDRPTAKARARDLENAISQEKWSAVAQVTTAPGTTTVAELVNAFKKIPLEVLDYNSDNTRIKAVSALRCILRKMGRSFEGTKLVTLDANFVLEYERVELAAAQEAIAAAPQADDRTKNLARTRARLRITSYLAQARMLFRPALADTFASMGVTVPDMTGFLTTGMVKAPTPCPRLLTAQEQEVWRSAFTSLRETDPALYAAYLLCYGLALRSSEAIAMRWGWLTFDEATQQGSALICDRPAEGFRCKGKSGRVPFGPNLWAELRKCANTAGEYVLPGSGHQRQQLVKRRMSGFMRAAGWDETKCAHALRAWRGQEWWTKYSPQECSAWLRHTSIRTTEEHYAGLTPGGNSRKVDL